MRCSLFLFFCICTILTSCRRLPDIQGKGDASLQGLWKQDSVDNSTPLLSYTRYEFKFTCDSFYVDLTTHSKVNYYEDSCFNKGIWREYAKGVYQITSDTIFLLGTYTKANYKQKISGCYNIGQYIKKFKLLSRDSTRLVMESTENQRAFELVLKQKITCVQQPL